MNWTPLPKPGTKWRAYRMACVADVGRDLLERCGLPRNLWAPIGWNEGGGLWSWLNGVRYPTGVTFLRSRPPTPPPPPSSVARTGIQATNDLLKALWPASRVENIVYDPATPLTESRPHWFKEKTTACSPVEVAEPAQGQFFGERGHNIPGLPRL